jgi:hypothetical protein
MAQPIYLDPELQGIERERQLAQALQQRGMKPVEGQMVSGRYVAPAWTQQLANAFDIYSGGQRMASAEKKAQDYASALRTQSGKDIQDFLKGGQAVVPEGQTLRDDEGGLTYGSQMPKPYMERVGALAQSRSPQSQALAQTLMADMLKPRELTEGASLVQMTPEGTYQTIGGGAPKSTNDIKNYQFDVSQGYKGTFNQWTIDQNRAKAQNINVQNAVPFQEQLYTDAAKALVTDYNTLKSIPSQVKQLDRVAQLAPKSFAGSAANAKLEGAKFLNNNLGLNIAPEKIVATEELRTVLFTNIMDNLKKMDASPSQEQQRIMQASLGNIGTDPAALPAVVNVYKQILLDKAEEHHRRVGQTVEKGFKYPYDITVNVPKAAPASPAGSKTTPNVGDIQNGWQYMGGNPAVPSSWKKVQ